MKTLNIFKYFIISSPILLFSCQSGQLKDSKLAKNNESQQNFNESEFFFDEVDPKTTKKVTKKTTVKKNVEELIKAQEKKKSNIGYAAWYGKELDGKPTASGNLFNMNKFTAAHRDFPFGSLVLVKNVANGKKKLVTINDRGPYVAGRVIDVSYATAKALGFENKGVAKVEIELIQKGNDDISQKLANENVIKKEKNAKNIDEDIADNDLKDTDITNDDDIYDDSNTKLENNNENTNDDEGSYTFADGRQPKGYTVQIGAFKRRINAEKHRTLVAKKYRKKTFIATKGNWHLIWIGDFKNHKKARRFYAQLKEDGVDVMYRGKPKEL